MSTTSYPVNRVPDILKRMDLNSSQAEAMKTCFGILAIMSRDETNKLLIAKDGIEIILNAMSIHVDRTDVQESGCDLLWSLAFNNSTVKEIIAKHGGATVLVRALKRHNKSSDFLKSACGALSNMCQSKMNQEGVSSQGGLQPLVGSIHIHQTNAKLLPFIFDAIASIVVNNEENARNVSSLGIIPIIVASLSRHKMSTEIVKSGCHTLAILSDVKGQASKIAFAGGVPIILSLLDIHPLYSDLHRVAAVVLLRMLQESAHVGREITCHEGIRILLNSLEKGGAQQDTVAAVTHILYTVTNPLTATSTAIESQLWLTTRGDVSQDVIVTGNDDLPTVASKNNNNNNPLLKNNKSTSLTLPPAVSNIKTTNSNSAGVAVSALSGIATILSQYCSRRDVVRAACRLISNLSVYPNVLIALDQMLILDKMLECVFFHKDTKDVVESTSSLIKVIHKKSIPQLQASSTSSISGLLHVFRSKSQEEDIVVACIDMFLQLIESYDKSTIEKKKELDETRLMEGGKIWEYHALSISISLLDAILEVDHKDNIDYITSLTSNSSLIKPMMMNKQQSWSKGSIRIVNSVLSLIEALCPNTKLTSDSIVNKDCVQLLHMLVRITPPPHPNPVVKNYSDVVKRVEKLIPLLDVQKRNEKYVVVGRKPIKNNNNNNNGEEQLQQDKSSSSSLFVNNNTSPNISHRKTTTTTVEQSRDNLLLLPDNKRDHHHQSSSSMEIGIGMVSSNGYATPKTTTWIQESSDHQNNLVARDVKKVSNNNNKSLSSSSSCYVETIVSGVKKLFPLHPSKVMDMTTSTCCLLECWPNYLERLSTTSSSSSFLHNNDFNGNNNRMALVYESTSAGGKGLLSKCPTPVPYVVTPEGCGLPFDHSLTFDSDFESGNLLRAVQKSDAEYDLFLRSDLHTPGHTQWFYFAVSNTHPSELVRLSEQGVQVPPVRVRFHIINLTKPDSLFNIGMRPVVYSCHDAITKGVGWIRSGVDISYYSNPFMRNNNAGEGVANYYTLSFTIEFNHPKDTVLIAYSYPYTMEDYRVHIQQILSKTGSSDIIRQTKLCKTLGGEDCDLLVITNFKEKEKDRIGPITMTSLENRDDTTITTNKQITNRKANVKQLMKPALFLSGRVHPGETPASWMMKGILDYLTSDCSQAKLLRQVFVIFVIPILNPDGVIYGNNRCSLAGVDLNRQWKVPSKALHPTIYSLKYFMMAQKKLRGDISMYIDLHGHSRKYNVFMYGCDGDKKKPKPQVRAFPKFFSMHTIGRKYVCYSDCSFHVKKGRESTARVVVAKEINIPCSFTLEATFCGSNYGPLKHCHMNIGHLQEVGAALCDAILNFSISEGQVKDIVMVPAGNLKAVAQVEKALAEDIDDDDNFFFSSQQQQQQQQQQDETTTLPEVFAVDESVDKEDVGSEDSDIGGTGGGGGGGGGESDTESVSISRQHRVHSHNNNNNNNNIDQQMPSLSNLKKEDLSSSNVNRSCSLPLTTSSSSSLKSSSMSNSLSIRIVRDSSSSGPLSDRGGVFPPPSSSSSVVIGKMDNDGMDDLSSRYNNNSPVLSISNLNLNDSDSLFSSKRLDNNNNNKKKKISSSTIKTTTTQMIGIGGGDVLFVNGSATNLLTNSNEQQQQVLEGMVSGSPRSRRLTGSTIIKSDFMDQQVTLGQGVDTIGLSNAVSIVKSQAPATIYSLPKMHNNNKPN